ncbi:MAG: FtsQ-type POTRA domain-containing protein [Cyanobacteriota bacterium]|nr:FtsQ-type POTRA domain-containing protein [Cyanobacteriota bacterium]
MRTVSRPRPRSERVRSPEMERRRQLRLQKRHERLRQLWRLSVYSLMAAGLGYGLLRQGWVLRDPTQVQVSGSRLVQRDDVISAAGLRFPQPLLLLDPAQLDRRLTARLPVQTASVSRRILPPRLQIDLVDRHPVALAFRRSSTGLEQGYVDELGHWLSHQQQPASAGTLATGLVVRGWQDRHRHDLAQVLAARRQLGPGLKEIRFEPGGSLWLQSDRLGTIRLGLADGRLPRRLEVVQHLNAQLPAQLRGRRVQQIDLSDPDNPELTLPGTAQGPQLSTGDPSSAPPPGGQ